MNKTIKKIYTWKYGWKELIKHDNCFYIPSFPDDYSQIDAIRYLISGKPNWFFREVKQTNKKWWQFWKPEWILTGKTYITDNPDEFDLIYN